MKPYDPQGLTPDEVAESRQRHGENVITPPKDDSAWKLFIEKFKDPIIRILLVAAVLSLVIAFIEKEFLEPIGIICAIILATCVGFVFEWDAMRRFRRLNQVNDDTPVKVMRSGAVCEVPRREVVVGDLVCIENGETVPADGELVEAVSLSINESTLTGEPEVAKTVAEEHFDPEATYPSNVVMRGTTVVDGYGMMVVTAVGDATEAGRVTEQATVESDEQTPLNRQLTRLSRMIGRVGIVLSVVIFGAMLLKAIFIGGLLEEDWLRIVQQVLHIFMVSVALIVMAVPEGLPMSITLSLAMSMRRMLKTNNLVRRMHACETMGAVTVICTDKTGTLTQNKMHVNEVVRYDALPLHDFAEIVAANSTAFLDAEGRIIGNPTEGALLEWLRRGGEDYAALREGAEIEDRLTFTTERKYMATIIRSGVSGRRILCVKGAPEIVRAMCADDGRGAEIGERLLAFQNRAMRTLAVAWAETEAGDCETAVRAGGLHFAAVAAISDPVRGDVPAAVKACLDAGIAVKIVTGDTPATAREIARQIGLWDDAADGERNHMTGTEFAAMSDEELLGRVQGLKIMSRARPLDKQRLVRLLQQCGEVVAVTGDGTNDAPALNFANVGLSMGTGTSVAKDASDITLLDDSFTSIATAVMWGRSLYRNIQRFVLFQLTINFAAIVVCFVGAIFGTDLPLTVVQILWVNIIMDTFAAMAMASLPPNPEVMLDKPRPRDEFIITRAMARTIFTCGIVVVAVLLGMMFWWTATAGGMNEVQLTLFFSVFVFLQFWNMFNAKGFETKHSVFTCVRGCREFFLILLAIGIGQVLIVEVGGEVFRTVPLAWRQWAWVIGGTSLIAVGGELVRAVRRRVGRS
ncbi:calcium-translocating P-type ATPase, PMCA-type [Alistipes sp. CHKCI003]|uniref:calcium-translocating P-type ATPase, PMCA-type n=1 Tax=Alistipes sp. CHKCI003 TaxID=1780376 RepID=UPI0007A8D85A|nr:calcium-translocating P-type ATPase, PMCA-type [Alistipes sp. CHKCI003]CVI69632.1 Calcium-transporting ATPase [Alistipes sp. CHKCI003]HAW64133.1 calcium-translocating P-type ATPase, PMCA-type [Alistipes sp.]HJC75993.1 calcium-translocating P-type ATPase, PMCA-type [Candidatus Alistipes excrementavium]